MILLAVMVVIIFLIEMIRLIISRMKAFSRSIKADTKGDTIPLYALSAVLDLIVCYLAYKYTGITMDSFYNFVNEGKYLALPLMILFVGIAFVIFMRLTHATLVLLVAMKPEDVVSFLKRVNDKTKISEKVVEIIKMIIDIVLDSIITALSFVSFIRDYFNTIYSFVFGNECVFEYDEDVPDSYEELLDNTDTTSSKREV